MDEVLHRVGGDHPAVVALRVCVDELRAAHDHLDLRAGDGVVAAGERRLRDARDAGEWLGMRAVDLDIGLPVPDLVLHAFPPSASGGPKSSAAAPLILASGAPR